MAKGVIYIHRNGLAMYAPPLSTLVKYTFPQDVIRDLDVLNEESLYKGIQSLLTANKILQDTTFIAILANDTLFVKVFLNAPKTPMPPKVQQPTQPGTPPASTPQPAHTPEELKKFHQEQETQIQQFIERVPFENTSHKIITSATDRQVVVANKALYMSFKNVFQRLGYVIEAVVPALIFAKTVPMNTEFGPETAAAMLSHPDLIRQNDLSYVPLIQQPIVIGGKPGDPPPPKSRQYILIGVFIALFVFMIGLYYYMYIAPGSTKKAPPSTKKKAVTAKPSATISPVASNSADLSDLTIQIRASGTASSYSARLRTELINLGVSTITTGTSSVNSSSTLVVFSRDVPTATREAILTLVQNLTPRVTTQESTSGIKSVTVTFAR